MEHPNWMWLAAMLMGLAGSCFGGETQPVQSMPEPESFVKSTRTGPLQIGVIGMTHGHVEGVLAAGKRGDVQIVGIAEPNRALFDRLAKKYDLPESLYFASTQEMLEKAKPEAVSVMNSIREHLAAVEACAPRGIHVLVEKPLAFSNVDAERMAKLARQHGILVLTNYETSWYASVREAKKLIEDGAFAPLRKMVFRHGHKGPKEIGCAQEFLGWLTDPQANGGGAIVDFGCYGAVLATWFMDGQRPTSVVASATTIKPLIYPNVDDDATIVLTYPGATAVIQASWAWTHDNKEADFFTEKGSIHAAKWDALWTRRENGPLEPVKPEAKPPELQDEWAYLQRVVRGECNVDPLSSLEMNLVAVDILDRARTQVGKPGR